MNKRIVNADDFGASPSINQAIDYAFKEGIINRATLMVNMPYAQDAVQLAIDGGYIDKIGLHLCLDTGEQRLKSIIFLAQRNSGKARSIEFSYPIRQEGQSGRKLRHKYKNSYNWDAYTCISIRTIMPIILHQFYLQWFHWQRNMGSNPCVFQETLGMA